MFTFNIIIEIFFIKGYTVLQKCLVLMVMISDNTFVCPKCNSELKYYDSVQRVVRTKDRETNWVNIRRLRCVKCGSVHRELPGYIFPYKQYEAEVITGVLDGIITCETIGYEDYPCEATMTRWIIARNKHRLLWKGDNEL